MNDYGMNKWGWESFQGSGFGRGRGDGHFLDDVQGLWSFLEILSFSLVEQRFGRFSCGEMAEESYEEMAERLTSANEEQLAYFTNDLILEKKMGKRKAHEHAERLRLFANDYLVNYRQCGLLEGLENFPDFVGDWFIRKCMWSDENAVIENVESYRLLVQFLKETERIEEKRGEQLVRRVDGQLERWCRRARCYGSEDFEIENLFHVTGGWDDAALKHQEARLLLEAVGPLVIPGKRKLVLNLLLSAKVVKHVGIKPAQLAKMADWGDWNDAEHLWFSNWRCEESFGMKGTKDKVILVTNEMTRYSVLVRLKPKDPKDLLQGVHSALMRALDYHRVPRPLEIELAVEMLSGAARSLTSFQNQQMYAVGHILDRANVEHLDDAEGPLNDVPTKMGGEYSDPDDEFTRMCKEEPPFGGGGEPENVVGFLN